MGVPSNQPHKALLAAGVLSAAAVVVTLRPGSAPPTPDSQVCEVGAWENPVPLAPFGTLLRSPDLEIAGGRPIVAGQNSAQLDSATTGPLLVLVSVDPQEHMRPPRGPYRFIFPQLEVGAGDRVHLVWGESDDPASTAIDADSPVVTELWHATRSDGNWSEPTSVLRAPGISWSRGRAGLYLDPTDDVLNIVVDTYPRGPESGTGPTILIRVRDDAQVSLDTVFRAGTPIYMGLAGHAGAIHLAYADWHPEFGGTRVQVVSSQDLGRTWSERLVLNPRSVDYPSDTWVFADPSGNPHVVWLEMAGDPLFGSASLFHAWRLTGSREWTNGEPIPLPEGLNHRVAAMDQCGGLHLAGDALDGDGVPSLEYFQEHEGEWRSVAVPAPGIAALEPALEAGPGGLFLAWTEVYDGSSGGRSGFRVMASRRAIRER